MRLIPGIVALLGSMALALLNVMAYVRHLDSGDQAGFSLGTFFLIGWFLPITAALLLFGSVVGRPAGMRRGSRWFRIVAVAFLGAGAAFFIAYALWMKATFQHARQESGVLSVGTFVATVLTFSVTVVVCALLGRRRPSPRAGGARWLAAAMVALAVIVGYQIAAQVSGFISDGMLPIHFPFVVGPTLLWIAALVWSAWRLSR